MTEQQKRPKPKRATAAAQKGDTSEEELPEVPALQIIPLIRCPRCRVRKVLRVGAWESWRYYRCNGVPLCVDKETGRAFRFKVLKT